MLWFSDDFISDLAFVISNSDVKREYCYSSIEQYVKSQKDLVTAETYQMGNLNLNKGLCQSEL